MEKLKVLETTNKQPSTKKNDKDKSEDKTGKSKNKSKKSLKKNSMSKGKKRKRNDYDSNGDRYDKYYQSVKSEVGHSRLITLKTAGILRDPEKRNKGQLMV